MSVEYVRFEKGWLEKEYRQLQIDRAREAYRRWQAAPQWVKDAVLAKEKKGAPHA